MARLTHAIRHDRGTCFAGHGQATGACGMDRDLAQSDRVIRHDRANMSTQKENNPVRSTSPDRNRTEDRITERLGPRIGPKWVVLVRSRTKY